jgi:hypothetical protein
MENNVREVRDSAELRDGAEQLVERALGLARGLLENAPTPDVIARGGRKAHHLE